MQTYGTTLSDDKTGQIPGFSGSNLPTSLILHHVISRAPTEIPSPFAASDWTLDRYANWCLRTADESARTMFISRAVAAYVTDVEARKQRQYPPIFPLIRRLLERLQQSFET